MKQMTWYYFQVEFLTCRKYASILIALVLVTLFLMGIKSLELPIAAEDINLFTWLVISCIYVYNIPNVVSAEVTHKRTQYIYSRGIGRVIICNAKLLVHAMAGLTNGVIISLGIAMMRKVFGIEVTGAEIAAIIIIYFLIYNELIVLNSYLSMKGMNVSLLFLSNIIIVFVLPAIFESVSLMFNFTAFSFFYKWTFLQFLNHAPVFLAYNGFQIVLMLLECLLLYMGYLYETKRSNF